MTGPTVCMFVKTIYVVTRGLTSTDDIMSAILPEEELEEIPTGFTIVGHVGIDSTVLNIRVRILTSTSTPQPPRLLPPPSTPPGHRPP